MKNETDSKLQKLSELITPQCSGIVWVTENDLSYDLEAVYEFNYLLNGLLGKTISQQAEQGIKKNNFFLSESFGKPFFVAHTRQDKTAIEKNLSTHLEVVKNLITEKTNIYVFIDGKSEKDSALIKMLNKKYNHYNFIELDF